jgi:AcrR family transcriptional regulator
MAEVKTRRSRGALRPVAGREEILAAARSIGVREGWKAVTIRAVARMLGYTAPLLYEHFRDKQEILTQLAIEGQLSLARELARELPQEHDAAVLVLVQRYWSFMLEQPQIYRLMNGMDGVTIDRDKVGSIARGSFGAAKAALQAWFVVEGALTADVDALLDDLWAVLHGMATLYLDRSAAFDLERAQHCVVTLLMGTRAWLVPKSLS